MALIKARDNGYLQENIVWTASLCTLELTVAVSSQDQGSKILSRDGEGAAAEGAEAAGLGLCLLEAWWAVSGGSQQPHPIHPVAPTLPSV